MQVKRAFGTRAHRGSNTPNGSDIDGDRIPADSALDFTRSSLEFRAESLQVSLLIGV
jgi:hypothetical protein